MPDTAATADAIAVRPLLAYTGQETHRWEAWFRQQPSAALQVAMGDARWGTVGELVFHTFVVERRYGERLLDLPVSPYETVPHATLDELFAIHREARGHLERFVAGAAPDDWDRAITFETVTAGTQHASKRKIVWHALVHGVRHWAQIATALRQAGHPTDWQHDFLMTPTME